MTPELPTPGSSIRQSNVLSVLAGALALVAAGAGATYLAMRSSLGDDRIHGPTPEAVAPPAAPADDGHAASPSAAPWPDLVVPLSRQAVERAGIEVAPVDTGRAAPGLRLPAVVEPHAYRQVAVTPLVGGRVTRVPVALGDVVRRGQVLAEIYSPDLAEARTRHAAARAQLDAHDRELQRTDQLAVIGAASRQELERAHADHAAQVAEVEAARSRLELLGGEVPAPGDSPAAPTSATIEVPAPIDGIVTTRTANVGLNVDPSMPLFTVIDLSTVWVIADVYEQDLGRVRVGDRAVVTTAADPGTSLSGSVSYIDPQINTTTRTARLRVEVPNRGGRLRLGMYAEVLVGPATSAAALVIPRAAVQHIGGRTVVYLADSATEGAFIEREVRLGASDGDRIEVLTGLAVGDVVVTTGSFFVRAERERLGLRAPGSAPATPQGAADHSRH